MEKIPLLKCRVFLFVLGAPLPSGSQGLQDSYLTLFRVVQSIPKGCAVITDSTREVACARICA